MEEVAGVGEGRVWVNDIHDVKGEAKLVAGTLKGRDVGPVAKGEKAGWWRH